MSQVKLSDERRRDEIPARASRRTRHDKHGYRGYGSGFGRGTEEYGGAVHWGRGFAGVGSLGAYGGGTMPHAGFFTAEVWDQGPYTGLAPKGYLRSDDRIREEICDELTRRPDLDPSQVTVSVRNGEVTLEGTIENLSMRRLVDQIASDCGGVKQLHNRLRVARTDSDDRRPAPTRRSSGRPD